MQPISAEEVAVAVKVLTATKNCSFALRSGGHNPNAGTANIEKGVTIDLSRLNATVVSNDHSTVSVGPGATWDTVYTTLDPLNLTVAGGREAHVGVGGLTVGGGISFLSPRVGFTCDTVSNYQVVLANGSVVDSQNHGDLHFALSGGSNNFGIVTRIDFAAINQGQIWGGNIYYTIDTIDAQLRALAKISNAETYDDYASLIMTFSYAGSEDLSLVVNAIEYTKDEADPPVFQPLLDIPSIANTMHVDSIANIALAQAETMVIGDRYDAHNMIPNLLRGHASSSDKSHSYLYMTITHGNSLPMLNATYHAWSNSVANITARSTNRTDITWSLSLEPLPPAIYARNANNALGLSGQEGSLMVVLLTVSWTQAANDEVIQGTSESLFKAIRSAAVALGEYSPFLYLNYANTAAWQGNPIASYGVESVSRLRKAAAEVDPRGVFQKNVPGGYKLP